MKTHVRHHMRRTRRKVVPVRQHYRKNRGARRTSEKEREFFRYDKKGIPYDRPDMEDYDSEEEFDQDMSLYEAHRKNKNRGAYPEREENPVEAQERFWKDLRERETQQKRDAQLRKEKYSTLKEVGIPSVLPLLHSSKIERFKEEGKPVVELSSSYQPIRGRERFGLSGRYRQEDIPELQKAIKDIRKEMSDFKRRYPKDVSPEEKKKGASLVPLRYFTDTSEQRIRNARFLIKELKGD